MPSAKSPLKIITDMPCLFERKCFSGGISVMRYNLYGISYAKLNLIFSIYWVEVWYDSYARHMYARTYSKLIVKSVLNRLWNLIGRITYFLKFKSQKAKMTENFSAETWYLESKWFMFSDVLILDTIYATWYIICGISYVILYISKF